MRPLTEEEKQVIDSAPQEWGVIAKLAVKLNRNPSTIRSHLNLHGRQPFKNVYWTREEIAILAENKDRPAFEIAKIFRKNGFNRRVSSIYSKKLRMGFSVNPDADGNYSAKMIAEGLGMESSTIIKWIRRGWLKTKRPGGNMTSKPGVGWVITPCDLREFLIDYTAHVDYSNADKFFLTDILSGTSRGKQTLRMTGND